MLHKVNQSIRGFLWAERSPSESVGRVKLLGRMLYLLIDDLAGSNINLHAMSLVFTTFLALVPLLAVSFAVLQGFGLHNQIEPVLLSLLEPLGDKGVEITRHITGFVANARAGVLGSLGLLLLFYSAFSLIQKVESAFNAIWSIKRKRPFVRRLVNYLSVLVIGWPLILLTSLWISTTLMGSELVQGIIAIEPFGWLLRVTDKFIPFLIITCAYTFFFVAVPNTQVRLRPALLGGLVAGLLWQLLNWLFALAIAAAVNYDAIYSGFASLIFFMLWVYINWLILLFGALLVFRCQNFDALSPPTQQSGISIAHTEVLALGILALVGQGYYAGQRGVAAEYLRQKLKLRRAVLVDLLQLLKSAGLLLEDADQADLYVPAVPFDNTPVKRALDAIRNYPADSHLFKDLDSFVRANDSHDFAKLADCIRQADKQLETALGQFSLKQLVQGLG